MRMCVLHSFCTHHIWWTHIHRQADSQRSWSWPLLATLPQRQYVCLQLPCAPSHPPPHFIVYPTHTCVLISIARCTGCFYFFAQGIQCIRSFQSFVCFEIVSRLSSYHPRVMVSLPEAPTLAITIMCCLFRILSSLLHACSVSRVSSCFHLRPLLNISSGVNRGTL